MAEGGKPLYHQFAMKIIIDRATLEKFKKRRNKKFIPLNLLHFDKTFSSVSLTLSVSSLQSS